MRRVISRSLLVLLLSYVVFIAHTLAEIPEVVKNDFIAYRQRQRETTLSARSSSNIQSRSVIALEKPTHSLSNESIEYFSNWAGAVQAFPPSGTYDGVRAKWTLPTVSPPPNATGTGPWYSAAWVGIDGWGSCNTILQAGSISSVQIDSNGNLTTGASVWHEWLPEALIKFPDFSVDAGHTVEVFVTAASSSKGKVVVKNLSTGNSTSIHLSAPGNSSYLCGKSVEWILEDLSSNGGLVPFADFSPVHFEKCMASTTTGAMVDLKGAVLVGIKQNATVLATPSVVSSTGLEVRYG